MSATRTSRHQTISFHALVILLVLCQRCQCAMPVNVLTSASIESISSPDTKCCTSASTPVCSYATNSSRCPFDDDNSTVWKLSPDYQTITLTLRLQTPAVLKRLEVILDPSSTIPNSVTITAFNQDDNTDVSWTTYFNKTCQPNDPYLRKQGNRYYSCLNNQPWNSSLPDGLLSVRDVNGQWLWWKTFQKLTVTVTFYGSIDSADQTAATIAIADIRLYGWNPPSNGCNCHPAGLLNVSKPCYDNGTCICRSSQPNNDQCIPNANMEILNPSTNITYPNYGPVSGGTTVAMAGNFLSLLNDAIIGYISAKFLSGSENTMRLKTNAANESDIGNSLPIQLRFGKSNVFDSVVIADSEFTYKPNPNFTSITPKRTILSGGILLTVSGRNLDSIPYPFLLIVVIDKLDQGPQTTTYPESGTTAIKDINFCQKIESTTMICPTPRLPPNSNYNTQKTTVIVFIPPDIRSNSSDLPFCQPNIGQCSITVAPNPTITVWNDPNGNPIGFPYYNGQRIMHVKGNGFQYGIDGGDYKADYTITIGGVQCEIVAVIQNDITFYAPDPKSFGDASKKQPVILYIGYYSFTVGYVIYYRSWIDDPNNRNPLIGGLVGGIGGVIVLAIVVFLTVRYLRRRKRKDQLLQDQDYSYRSIAPYFPEDINKYSVDFDRINFDGELGKGNFGKVHKGTLLNPDDGSKTAVAIKTLHDEVKSFESKLEFLKEAMLMADFCHDHVLSLIAISIKNQKPYVILPLMENGDLRGFVSNKNSTFTAGHLVSFSLQVAEGMEYLAKMKFVHCDLAARNCMINSKFLVKVADFGLARDIFEKDYYRSGSNAKPLPVKWMALECLQSGAVFTEKSDVWSYGVLVWELMARGRKPYADVDNFAMKTYLESGRRLEKTDATPDFMYDLMQRCWLKDSRLRPTFQEIVQEIKTILSIAHSTEDDSSSPRYIDNNVVEAARRSYLQLTADD